MSGVVSTQYFQLNIAIHTAYARVRTGGKCSSDVLPPTFLICKSESPMSVLKYSNQQSDKNGEDCQCDFRNGSPHGDRELIYVDQLPGISSAICCQIISDENK
ncbi:unnamed protein product [Aspergillus oryzae var. brunneus]|uniref:Unnamed protein product n=2 Tax=Aspergillus oryzae TaxID=5062 RepID=A0AAN4Z0V8_ASPOZ|nr:unnamed protein product [Aspergillus oryzae]GMG37815.1 unnamed protein product [Aspergillus oryzae]GMG53571.1 unnamed protein product [Aspergillus oryzae var. brunneus]